MTSRTGIDPTSNSGSVGHSTDRHAVRQFSSVGLHTLGNVEMGHEQLEAIRDSSSPQEPVRGALANEG